MYNTCQNSHEGCGAQPLRFYGTHSLGKVVQILVGLWAFFCSLFFATQAYAGPFTCEGEVFQVQSGQLRIFNPLTSSYEDVGDPQGGYNATGYNIQDNFAYGSRGNNIIRIHADGSTEIVFDVGFGSFSGDADDNNTLWLRRANNRYVGVDLITEAQTDITFTGTVQGVSDVAYIPDGGTRYLVGFGGPGRAGIFDLDSETARRINVPGLPRGAYGATWTDVNGRLFTFHNLTGQIFEVFDVLSTTPTSTLVAQADPSNSNDGFSCVGAAFPNLPPIAVDDDFVTPIDVAVSGNALDDNGNGVDEDPEGGAITVNTAPTASPSSGSVVLNVDGTFTYTPNSGFIGTDTFDYEISDITGLTATATVTILIEGADIEITKTASITTDAKLGDTITYTYAVTNTGNIDLTNVHVTDVHSGTGSLSAITPSSVTLTEGQSQDFTATYVVTQADIDAGTAITNTATAQATPASGSLTPPTADETVTLIAPDPEAVFTKVASPDTGLVEGDIVSYSYTVENTGNVTLSNVSVSDVHEGTGSLSAISPASVASLAPGASQVFTATYEITNADFVAGGTIDNTASLAATPASGVLDPLTASETVSVDMAAPSVELSKQASEDTGLELGDVVTYSYVVRNDGNVDLQDVSIDDVHGGAGSLSAISPASVALLAIGDSASFTASYEITQADIDNGGAISNTASVEAVSPAGDFTSPTADETVTLIAPDPELSLTKTASDDTDVRVGDVITYSYVATNIGNVTMSDVSISDVHSGTGSLSAISPASVASLAVGASASFTATYTVTQADIIADSDITNVATVAATPASGVYVPVSAEEVVTVESPLPSLSMTKVADDDGPHLPGTVITYTYTVTNNGNQIIRDIAITDTHNGSDPAPVPGNETLLTDAAPVGDSIDAAINGSWDVLAPGDILTFTGTYTVTQNDAENL